MKKFYLLFLITAVITTELFAQRKTAKPDETKYRINLPDYLGKRHKVMTRLIDKLPVICEELKDKDVCGDDCYPAFSIDFYITEAIVFDYTVMEKFPVMSTNTQLNARQELARMNNPIDFQRFTNYPLSNTNNKTWVITTNYGFQCFLLLRDKSGKILSKMVLTDTNEVWSKRQIVNVPLNKNYIPQTPQSYIEKNGYTLAPLPKELMEIAERKILEL